MCIRDRVNTIRAMKCFVEKHDHRQINKIPEIVFDLNNKMFEWGHIDG